MMNFIRKYWLLIILGIALVVVSVRWYTRSRLSSLTTDAGNVETLSFLGDYMMPRGIANNNPGNLVRTSIAWDGKIPHSQSTDQNFEQFYYYWQGVRAMIKDLINDMDQDGANTIRKIIYRYAPPEENHTDDYIAFVSNETGYPADQELTTGSTTMFALVRAMAHFENGMPDAITEPIFNYAYSKI